MRIGLMLCALGLCAICSGCNLAVNATRNLINEPVQYTDNVLVCVRNRVLAKQAWSGFGKANPGQVYSTHYASGFKEGFADYLDAGGTGAPPPLPPCYYRLIRYQTVKGHSAIDDWYAGFHQGAAAAQESGYRQLITLPPSAPFPYVLSNYPIPSGPPPELPAELLPFPRVMPPAPGEGDGEAAAEGAAESNGRAGPPEGR